MAWSKHCRLRGGKGEVFIEEQKVPRELEWDEWDEHSEHAMHATAGRPIGTARCCPTGEWGVWRC